MSNRKGRAIEPRISIIIPCRNEEEHIETALMSVLSQEEPLGGFEVILVDGRSDDLTLSKAKSIAAADKRLIVVENPQKVVSTAMNIGIRKAQGEVVIRMDAHCEYPIDYVQRLINLLETSGAANVGGVLVPIGTTKTQEAIGAAYRTSIGTGVALRSRDDDGRVREVDSLWQGCWWRAHLLEIGLFDEAMVRNQDDELCFRLRKMGGRILQSSAIRVLYSTRNSYRRLFEQFLQYGFWKVRLIRKHPGQSRPRHYIPALLVTYLLAFSLGTLLYPALSWGLITGLVAYAAVILLSASREAAVSGWHLLPGIIIALVAMHFGYGIGFVIGLINLTIGRPSASSFQRLTR